MKKIGLLVATSLLVLSFSISHIPPAQAHREVEYGDVRVNVGWVNEPPLVGQLNGVVMEVTRVSNDQPIANALAQMDISIKKGTQTKPLNFQPQEEQGVYVATILPTQTGQHIVALQGTIAGQAINDEIQIEDTEDTARFEFPPAAGGASPEVLAQLQTVISDLAAQVDEANIAAEEAKEAAADATESASDLKLAADRAYMFGIIGVGVGVAGIAIGVAALSRREKV